MRKLFRKIKLYFNKRKVARICNDIDWAKGILFKGDTHEQELAKHYIDCCNYELLEIEIN